MERAFAGTKIKSLEVDPMNTELARLAFSACSVEKVIFKDTALNYEIEECVFSKCKNLQDVEIDEGCIKINLGAFSENNISNLKLPTTLTELGANCFYKNSLTSLDLSNLENLKTLSRFCFAKNKIKDGSLKLPLFSAISISPSLLMMI